MRGRCLLTEKLSVHLPPGTQARIDALRCEESRAEFLHRILLEALDGIEEPVSTQDCENYDTIQEELISLIAGSDLDANDGSNMRRVISETVVQ